MSLVEHILVKYKKIHGNVHTKAITTSPICSLEPSEMFQGLIRSLKPQNDTTRLSNTRVKPFRVIISHDRNGTAHLSAVWMAARVERGVHDMWMATYRLVRDDTWRLFAARLENRAGLVEWSETCEYMGCLIRIFEVTASRDSII